MPLSVARVRHCLQTFDFKTLFIQELGWDRHSANLTVATDGKTFTLHAIAEKRGMQVFECPPGGDAFPDYPVRRRIERQVGKSAYEHLIIYTDAGKTLQTWQWLKREQGRPLACREHTFHTTQPGDALIQKLQHLAFALEEEENLSLVHVTQRTRQAFDVDRITKRFYDRFKTEHAAFLKFIKGITDMGDREWYASLMLNRLMFVYFIQKKGFLDGDNQYLRNRLKMVREGKGKDRFLSFYRYFLLRLFHEGLGQPADLRKKDLEGLIGDVPYLNGGLFDVHDLETANPDIQIPDEAFEKLFDFFDAYQWHLDERPLRADNEINPDVLGYIFEKYINQKQMGAYYTKEDITGYIARNTVVPFLFNAAEKKCAIAFKPESAVWQLLRDDPDRYIYPAVRHGVDMPMPPAVAAGATDLSRRGGWNGPTTPEFGLPTETWREYMARRKRCEELRTRLKAGEIRSINDLVTYNLDITQFAEDVIENCEGPELLRAFYRSIAGHIPEKSNEKHESGMSVLDPACGSGAFLFAALNILEPLYEACLDRMEAFLEDLQRSTTPHHPAKFSDFRKVLDEVARHPNRRYFILKSIIINNLYGVDIMEEAVEICKLRLFLKLVAQVEKVQHLEPLPDIDFNIRAGNSLVGFASLDEVKKTLEGGTFAFTKNEVDRIIEEADIVDRAFKKFREMQTEYGMDAKKFSEAKVQLRKRLDKLRTEMDRYLAGEYKIDASRPEDFEKWRDRCQPFHWFAEFYGIMADGGFHALIGNPPWKEYSAVKKDYVVRGYVSEPCGNPHCLFTERSLDTRSPVGRMSFIVQLPMVSSSRMSTIRNYLAKHSSALHVIPFDDRPGKLFDGLQHCRSVIFLSFGGSNAEGAQLFTTRYQRWPTEVRQNLFAQIEYAKLVGKPLFPNVFPKYANDLQEELFARLNEKAYQKIADCLSRRETKDFIFYQEATQYWVKATYGLPYYAKNGKVGAPAHGRYLYFTAADDAHAACAVLNSTLFYGYFIAYGDCFHLSEALASGFPVNPAILKDKKLVDLNKKLMKDLRDKAERKTINTKDGADITYDEFYGGKSKIIIDEIDRVLAKHYGLTNEELDFIINYDIKYRMGQEAEAYGED
jgi:hypothetical protein